MSWWSTALKWNLASKSCGAFQMLSNFLVRGIFSHAPIIGTFFSVVVTKRAPPLVLSCLPLTSITSEDTVLEDEEGWLLELLVALELLLLSSVAGSTKTCNVGSTTIAINSLEITPFPSSFS